VPQQRQFEREPAPSVPATTKSHFLLIDGKIKNFKCFK
jgi:hypothetical protein